MRRVPCRGRSGRRGTTMIACFSFWLCSSSRATIISARLFPEAGGDLISRYCSPPLLSHPLLRRPHSQRIRPRRVAILGVSDLDGRDRRRSWHEWTTCKTLVQISNHFFAIAPFSPVRRGEGLGMRGESRDLANHFSHRCRSARSMRSKTCCGSHSTSQPPSLNTSRPCERIQASRISSFRFPSLV